MWKLRWNTAAFAIPISMIDNEWGVSQYPVIAGHEVIGRVSALGDAAKTKASLLVSAWASAGPPKAANTATPALTATVNCLNGSVPTIANKGGFAESCAPTGSG